MQVHSFKKMGKKTINFVITDLDDTLWDWLKMWSSSFKPFLNRISHELEIDMDILKANFKKLHKKYHTSEASPFLEDLHGLTSDQVKFIRNATVNGKSILHEYNSNKKNNLLLYKDVRETLISLKEKGTKVIGYTESNSFFTKYRITHLDLDGLLDVVYAPEDVGTPVDMEKFYNEDFWQPQITTFRHLPKFFKKPDVKILNTIFTDFNASKEKSIYIGDKLDRDIFMAQQAGVCSVFAKYGHNLEDIDYGLLKDVTHWSEEEVLREIEFKENYHSSPQPDYILENSFSQLNNFFDFKPF